MKNKALLTLSLISCSLGFSDQKTESKLLAYEKVFESSDQKQNAHTQDNQGAGFYASGSFLYWKNMEENLSYAIRQTPPSADPPPVLNSAIVTLIGDLKTVQFDWDPGFKVKLGYDWGKDNFNLFAQYTYFYNKGSDFIERLPDGETAPYHYISGLFAEFFGPNLFKINTNVKLKYHVLDLALQRPIFDSNNFILNFLFGGKGAWIKQDWFIRYFYSASVDIPYATIRNNWDFNGGGPLGGLNCHWQWGWGLGLNFQTTVGAILGSFDNFHSNVEIDYSLPESNNEYIIANIDPTSTRIIPTYQFAIGLEWSHAWERVGMRLFADWELNLWDDLNQTYRFPERQYDEEKVGSWTRESVALQGLTLGAQIEF